MNEQIEDGGPAFPRIIDSRVDREVTTHDGSDGMSLRDYFAAKAIQGMLAVPDDRRYGDRSDKALSVEEWQAWCVDGLIEHAYRVADAAVKMSSNRG